jgi:hypothetical protein
MIYTCYEMIRDCRANKPEGWRYFVSTYVPVIRKLLAHYGADPAALEKVLRCVRKPESSLFQSLEPAPERWFVAELRQTIMAQTAPPASVAPLDLESLSPALEPLTLVEKQVAWLESMRYTPAETGVHLRMAPKTAEKIRGKVADLIRGHVDSWSSTMLAESGRSLGTEALVLKGEECLTAKTFLDLLDGRTTWQGRDQLERHVTRCWHCIDYYCRLVETVEVLRGNQPIGEAEAAPLLELLDIRTEAVPVWKRWLGGRAKK